MKPRIPTMGYASGIAAGDTGCGLGPIVVQGSKYLETLPIELDWQGLIYPQQKLSKIEALSEVARLCELLAEQTYQQVTDQTPFIVIGGDHSSAIGAWSGAAAAAKKPIALLWFDAHMDAHTPQTSPSLNIHGMPVATLLGHGHTRLTHLLTDRIKVKPEHLCLIGIHNYEPDEAELLKNLGVHVVMMDEIQSKGLSTVLQKVVPQITKGTSGLGISIDLDALDPNDAPGVGTPVSHGLSCKELCNALAQLESPVPLLGLEISEFNPNLDIEHKTERDVFDLIKSLAKLLIKEKA